MEQIQLCFGISGFRTTSSDISQVAKTMYEKTYKHLASFLYENEDFGFSFFFSGTVLDWFCKKHKEYLAFIEELVSRGQVEILGGGYYNPHFPLLQATDRAGQIELLTTSIRKHFKVRARGCFLEESVWTPSLISTLDTLGIDYVLLDSELLSLSCGENLSTKIAIVEDTGKSSFVVPLHNDLLSEDVTPNVFVQKVLQLATCKNTCNTVCCMMSAELATTLIEKKWFLELKEILKEYKDIVVTTPAKALKNENNFVQAVAPSTMSKRLEAWTKKPYCACALDAKKVRGTIEKFKLLYPEIRHLYDKMMHVAMLVKLCRGDKARKKSAQEELWKAQNGEAYWYFNNAGFTSTNLRRSCYSNLIQAEKYLRDAKSKDFVESLNSFDINFDGRREYVAEFDQYNAYLSLAGGMIYELDILKPLLNYADTVNQSGERKFFTDYLLNDEDYASLKAGNEINYNSAKNIFSEQKFDRLKKDIKLECNLQFNKKALKLEKKFHFTKEAIRVEYRLTNNSSTHLNAWFVVENNMAMSSNAKDALSLDATDDNKVWSILPQKDFSRKNILTFRANNAEKGVCFTITSSDLGDFYTYPCFCRQEYLWTAAGFAWNVHIEPGAVLSRTVTLYLKVTKASSKKN